jgi:adenylate cyclase
MAAIIGYLYLTNTDLALDTAKRSMEQSSQDVGESVQNLVNSVRRIAHSTATLAEHDPDSLRAPEGRRVMLRQIKDLTPIYSIFVGFDGDGAYSQVLRLPAGLQKFGPRQMPPPAGSEFVLQYLSGPTDKLTDNYTFLSDQDQVVGTDTIDGSTFKPKARPWYQAALNSSVVVISDVYIFTSTRLPGLTASMKAVDPAGKLVGVAGINLSLDNLSTFLERKKVGPSGRVVVIDQLGRLIIQSEAASGTPKGTSADIIAAADSPDPLIRAAVAQRAGGAGDRFDGLTQGNRRFLATFTAFSPVRDTHWTIGVMAYEDEMTGGILSATLRVVALGGAILLVAVLAIRVLAQQLTNPLRRIAGEARRIGDFDLNGEFVLRSRIIEVADLAKVIASMKTSLINFSAYVPKDLVRSIVASGQQVSVGGERREITMLFTDIQNFTGKSEALPPEDVLTALSTYFQALSEAIQHHGGTIDKFIGDAIMAIWNAPQFDEDHVANACRALLACSRACDALNAANTDSKLFPMTTRFGLHCGEAMVGNVGSNDRLQYTVLGAAVNLASRIEGLNKVYGTRLLVSDSVRERVKDRFILRPVDLVAPVGTQKPVVIWELLAERREADDDLRPIEAKATDWTRAYAVYSDRDWAGAAEAFQSFEAAYGADKLTRLYVERCERFIASPPPPDWNGVQAYDHK